jgi:uncharacterized phage-associated protein
MDIAKLMYFADKASLEKYGRFISHDSYVAMEHGPVPSHAYDIMKAAEDSENYGFHVEGNYIKPDRNADTDELSDSDIECLDKVIGSYGKFPTYELRNFSHDEAWAKVWAERGNKGSNPMPVEDIVETLDEEQVEGLLDYLQNQHNDE